MPRPDLVVASLLRPATLEGLGEQEWDLLIRQARRANLLGRLAHQTRGDGGFAVAIPAARLHLLSAMVVAERQRTAIRWEVECIRRALVPSGVPLVLLKGAAYVMAGLPIAQGRMFADVDIIVPKQALPQVESALMMQGWVGNHHDAYDQRYYRQWMHEIPPMQHLRRGTVIDVHHAILPETARVRADSQSMREAAVAVPGHDGVFVLAPTDMVLHSATHLFHEGEFDNGLRDLFDIDGLLRHFAGEREFWSQLAPRAAQLGLTRPLYYALRHATAMLGTPVPPEVMNAVAPGGPSTFTRALTDFCFSRCLRPNHLTCRDRGTPWARALLYLRAHWLRMPMHLLAYHLVRKALLSPKQRSEADPAAGAAAGAAAVAGHQPNIPG